MVQNMDLINKNQFIQQRNTTSEMSQYNKNANLDNYLAKNSLFKSTQKNKLVSPYVSHLNYFEREDDSQKIYQSSGNNAFENTFKKEYAIPSKNSESPYESKNDILKPTSKKQFLQPRQYIQTKIVQSFTSNGNQYSNGNKKAEMSQYKQKYTQNQYQHNSNFQIQPPKNNSYILNPRQSKLQIDQYNTKQVFNAFNQANDEQNKEKIQSKLNSQLIHLSQKQLASRRQYKADSMFIVKQQQTIKSNSISKDSQVKFNNPYYSNQQILTKKGLTSLKKTDSKNFDLVPINLRNMKDQQTQVIEEPKQTVYNIKYSSPQKNQNIKIHHNNSQILNSIKNSTCQYLTNANQRLNKCYKCLESLESEVDILLDNNLDQQCNNLKQSLFRLIQIQIEEFKERERHQLRKSKFYFMADLYEIKCNIGLRLQQIEDYNHLLSHQYKWKNVIGNIMTPNYEQNIKFIEQKTDQIYKECDTKTDHYLTIFKKSFHQNIALNIQKQMKKIFHDIFERFIYLQKDKKRNQVGSMEHEAINIQNSRIYSH